MEKIRSKRLLKFGFFKKSKAKSESRFFFSPQPCGKKTNEYVDKFFETLSAKVPVLNYGRKPISRSVDYARYSLKADVMLLNWPIDTLFLRFGILQTLLSLLTFIIYRLRGGKVVWVCHNKDSHTKKYKVLRKWTRDFYGFIANIIIVHSKDAIDHLTKYRSKVRFLPHPAYRNFNNPTYRIPNKIDVLIWGNILRYKGLDEFIENYRVNHCSSFVQIIGKGDPEYVRSLTEKARGLNISIINQFLSEEELAAYFESSKIILLPYLNTDTFSSGALIHSINSKKVVMGPALGNFLDLSEYNACLVYRSNEQLFENINKLINDTQYYQQVQAELSSGIDKYINENSWEYFIERLLKIVNQSKDVVEEGFDLTPVIVHQN